MDFTVEGGVRILRRKGDVMTIFLANERERVRHFEERANTLTVSNPCSELRSFLQESRSLLLFLFQTII